MKTNRRHLLAGVGAAATLLTAPAIHAQAAPAIRWRLATSFPKSLGVPHGNADRIAKHLSDLTDWRFNISVPYRR